MTDTREHLHQLIDRLPPAKLAVAEGLLETILDEEEISVQEDQDVEEAKNWLRENGGKGIPHEEVVADFGLSMEDFLRMGEERAQRRRG